MVSGRSSFASRAELSVDDEHDARACGAARARWWVVVLGGGRVAAYLGGLELWVASKGHAASRWRDIALAAEQPHAGAEVAELGVTVEVDQHILRLEVAVHDVERVQVAKRKAHLRRITVGLRHREPPMHLQHGEEIATAHLLETDV